MGSPTLHSLPFISPVSRLPLQAQRPSPNPLAPWLPRATVAPDSNKLKHSRGTKIISPPWRRRQHALLLDVKTYTTHWPPIMHNRPSPGLLLASHSRFRIRQHPRVPPRPRRARPPGMSRPPCSSFHCSFRLVASPCVLCLPVCSCLPSCLPFLSFPFLCLGLPSSRRTVLPSTAACQAHRTILPPAHPRRRLQKKQHFPIAASVARHRTAQPTSCASNGCGERG